MLPVVIILNVVVLSVLGWLLVELRRLRLQTTQASPERQRISQLEGLLATIPDPLIVLDCSGRCVEKYPAANKTRALYLLEHLSESDRNTLNEQLREAIKTQQRIQRRFFTCGRAMVADIWPLPGSSEPPAAAVCLRDVTEREQSASELHKLSARNRAILRSAMDGFFVVDEQYHFQDVNEAFCRMTGYSADELLKMRITDIEVSEPPHHPADNSPMRTGLHQFATAHRHKDGHIIRLETSLIVLRDDGHKILVGFARDVTERLRAEETFERLSHQNKLILDSAAEGIFGVDIDGRFSFANPAAGQMFGSKVQDLIGINAHELVQCGGCAQAPVNSTDCILCRIVRDGEVQQASDIMFNRKDGSEFPVDCVSSPIYEHGKLTGTVVVFRDVSERKQADEERRQLEARFQQSQKLESLGLLAGGLAHDFNNLLLSVLCNASLAAEQVPSQSRVHPHLEKVIKAGRRASELTRQMLVYSGQGSYDVQPMALNELVDDMADLIRAALPKTIQLNLQLEPTLPMIKADSAQLQQVVMNLLINAAEASRGQTGTVTVKTELRTLGSEDLVTNYVGHQVTPGQYVCLEVRDDGCGMAPETLAKIFDPFFSTKATGRGLGLSAILGIVRSHRGAVSVHSRPNQGTTFTIVVPPTNSPAVRQVQQQAPGALPHGATVLVIDDEEDIREVVQAVLESRGVRVLTANDGPEGVTCFREHADEVDVVLLDMTMPGLGGEEVFREILSIRSDARVIMSSGYSEQDTLERLDDERMVGFVPKPYTAQSLVDTIGAALQ